MFCARLFICALWSPAGKGLTSWLSFVVSSVSLSLSHWYPGSGVVLDCIDSWSLQPYYFDYIWFTSTALKVKIFGHIHVRYTCWEGTMSEYLGKTRYVMTWSVFNNIRRLSITTLFHIRLPSIPIITLSCGIEKEPVKVDIHLSLLIRFSVTIYQQRMLTNR